MTNRFSSFEARFTEDSRYICWSKADIDRFYEKNPGLSGRFNAVASRYLVDQINKLALTLTGNGLVGNMQPGRA